MDFTGFRKLNAQEVECRVSTVSVKGCSLLLFKDARVDQNLLDETFGIFGWQRKHEMIDGQLFCTVSVKNPDTGEWVSKQDVGTESYTEKEKGRASDSFKRACFNLGIGRELYTAPFIWVSDCEIENKNGKYTTYDKFNVVQIGYDSSGNINHLVIENSKTGKTVYTFGGKGKKKTETKSEPKDEPKEESVGKLTISETKVKALTDRCQKDGVHPATITEKCGVGSFSEITEKQFSWILANWTKEFVNGN